MLMKEENFKYIRLISINERSEEFDLILRQESFQFDVQKEQSLFLSLPRRHTLIISLSPMCYTYLRRNLRQPLIESTPTNRVIPQTHSLLFLLLLFLLLIINVLEHAEINLRIIVEVFKAFSLGLSLLNMND